MMKYMEKGYYHVYSFGEDTPKLLTSQREFVVALNLLAYCSLIFDCKILAFAFMNSHFHLVLYGTEEECRLLGTKLMKMILHRINRGRNNPYAISETDTAYDLRNPIEAGFRYDPRYYKWCSAVLYFVPEEDLERGGQKRIGEFSRRTRIAIVGAHYEYPDEWTVDEEGLIHPRHYVDYKGVESIFGSIKAFIAFMYIKKDRVFELNKICSRINFQALSDEELAIQADRMSERIYGRVSRNIDIANRIELARKLKVLKGTGVKQLARVLEIEPSVLETLL